MAHYVLCVYSRNERYPLFRGFPRFLLYSNPAALPVYTNTILVQTPHHSQYVLICCSNTAALSAYTNTWSKCRYQLSAYTNMYEA